MAASCSTLQYHAATVPRSDGGDCGGGGGGDKATLLAIARIAPPFRPAEPNFAIPSNE